MVIEYKMNMEIQFFRKRIKFPVFWGGTLSINFPLGDSKYGFTPSKRDELYLMAMSSYMPFQKFKLAIKSIKEEEGGDMNDFQWDGLLENQRRNLEDPSIEVHLDNSLIESNLDDILK